MEAPVKEPFRSGGTAALRLAALSKEQPRNLFAAANMRLQRKEAAKLDKNTIPQIQSQHRTQGYEIRFNLALYTLIHIAASFCLNHERCFLIQTDIGPLS